MSTDKKQTKRFKTTEEFANNLFKFYLTHSYRYYILDQPVTSDENFDSLCKQLLQRFDDITHPDKALVDRSALEAGTGFQLQFKYPEWVIEYVNTHRY